MVTHTITIHGSSDDLICLDGFIRDEFIPNNSDYESILRFNDGTSLAVKYDEEGCWRIRPLTIGEFTSYEHVPAIDPDDDVYYDTVTLVGPITNVQFINNK
jgi:hypothetical protein